MCYEANEPTERPERYRLEGTTPVPVGVSADELSAWERWRETAGCTVAQTRIGAAQVEIRVDTFFRPELGDDLNLATEVYREDGHPLHFVTTVAPADHQRLADLPEEVDGLFSIDTAMERRIAVIQELLGDAPAEDALDGAFPLFAIEKGAPTWDAAERDHQLVVEVVLAVLQDRGVAIPGGVKTTWTRAARR